MRMTDAKESRRGFIRAAGGAVFGGALGAHAGATANTPYPLAPVPRSWMFVSSVPKAVAPRSIPPRLTRRSTPRPKREAERSTFWQELTCLIRFTCEATFEFFSRVVPRFSQLILPRKASEGTTSRNRINRGKTTRILATIIGTIA
jgi:hypothetical protein